MRSYLKSQRAYIGEEMAEPLVGWLNKRRKTTNEAKIVQLFERIQKFTRSSIPFPGSSIWLTDMDRIEFQGREFESPALIAQIAKKGKLPTRPEPELVRINKKLRRYKVNPSLIFQIEDRWRVTWESPSRGSELVDLIVRLAQKGLLLRIRRCGECEKWFFARFNHQTFCSRKCRQRNFRESEKGRQQRREYMRNYMRERYRKSK